MDTKDRLAELLSPEEIDHLRDLVHIGDSAAAAAVQLCLRAFPDAPAWMVDPAKFEDTLGADKLRELEAFAVKNQRWLAKVQVCLQALIEREHARSKTCPHCLRPMATPNDYDRRRAEQNTADVCWAEVRDQHAWIRPDEETADAATLRRKLAETRRRGHELICDLMTKPPGKKRDWK